MIILKALLGMIVGAIVGVILFVGLTYPLFLAAEGGRDMNGGIAMGMVTGIGPLGLIVGAVAGLVFVLSRSNPTQKPKQDDKPSGKRGLILIWIIGLFALGYFALLFFLQGPAKISMQTEPDMHIEFRTSTASLVNNDEFTPRIELFGHHENKIIPVPTNIKIDGDEAVLSGVLHVEKNKGYEKMRLRAWFSPDLIVDATTPLYPGMEVVPGLTKWDEVDFITMPLSDETELGYSQDIHMYRYQVFPHEK